MGMKSYLMRGFDYIRHVITAIMQSYTTHTHTHTHIHHAACINEQDRQCTYNVTMKRVHITIFAVEKQ